ncbi:MAG: MMPL family transporter, partial [Polyangiaceae bacterium]
MSNQGPVISALTRRWVDFLLTRSRWVWAVILVLALPATVRTVWLYAHLKSDLEELLPRESTSVIAIDELRARMPGIQYLGVIVDTSTAENLPSAERFIDDLASKVSAYPDGMVRAVRVGDAEERAFLEEHGALYVDLDDLKTIRARIKARRDYEVTHRAGIDFDDEPPPSVDLSDIQKKYDEKNPHHDRFKNGRFSSLELRLTMMLIQVGGFDTGANRSKELLTRVKSDIAALGGVERYAPGMRVGFAGDVAISVEETEALMADLSVSSVIVLIAVVAVIVLYFRWWRSVVVLVPPLLVATVLAFGVASLPPFSVSDLNSNTAFLGSIIVGNGINFGILLVARYLEERRAGGDVRASLYAAVQESRGGTLAAALAAGVSYASLIITQFRGFRQFGYIGGIGMVLSWLLAYTLMPPLIAWVDRGALVPRASAEGQGLFGALSRVISKAPVVIIAGSFALTLFAGVKVSHFDKHQLESDFSKLRRADTWTQGEGYWGEKMNQLLGEYLTPLVVLTDSTEQRRELEPKFKQAIQEAGLSDKIASIRTIDDVVPAQQSEKIEEIRAIKKIISPRMRAEMTEQQRADVDRFLGSAALSTIDASQVPSTFSTGLRERDGSMDKAILVYPTFTKELWLGDPLISFVRRLREIAADTQGRPGRVAGSIPLSADILSSISRDGPLA